MSDVPWKCYVLHMAHARLQEAEWWMKNAKNGTVGLEPRIAKLKNDVDNCQSQQSSTGKQ